jgi:hypothetical protein
MKRILTMVAVLFLAATMPAFALNHDRQDDRRSDRTRDRSTVVDEVIRMSQAGVGDDEIISFIRKSRDNYVISADELIAMADAKVSRDVMKAVINEAADRRDVRPSQRRVYVAPYGGWYDPWYRPYWYGGGWYGSPWYYGPRFGVGVRFGPRRW